MTNNIINRVANSKLELINLEDYYPHGKRVVLDIKDWLYEELVLREKEFRQQAKLFDWEQYNDCYVALTCSSNAIVPAWAYMLLSTYLAPFANKTILGSLDVLETSIYQDIIKALDVSPYKDKSVIIKGCTNKPIPDNAFIQLTTKLKPLVKSLMYGEACSAVPLYKRK
ncbi:DUF2480 family protein [Flavobacteriaceae bacterium]|jgi:hypothetical protein|nr:hypothetical protein [Flavobacteriaceae bacterium]MCP4801486.1 DUF2480 family protein [Bacteroidota bacterium]MDA9551869.1 DUF2480 family protein [Flavobacteriaceae bacterium]MDB2471150.1 DUF2480 family protein [Flavobacteriaceae bacterium]MDC3242255.1 DUF2480 family protein [Flavobacteriaceae bacterium]|tara:strand:- start:176 stop:682 length:507 start_codon:yes stop_codon:yes gene_type:complete